MISPVPTLTYRAEWDAERGEYQSRCLEFSGRYAAAFTAHEAVAAMERIVEEELAMMADAGERPPEPLTDRRLRGKILMVEANEQGVSLNRWAVEKLADRSQKFGLGDLFG